MSDLIGDPGCPGETLPLTNTAHPIPVPMVSTAKHSAPTPEPVSTVVKTNEPVAPPIGNPL
jgi:hypothetical protein